MILSFDYSSYKLPSDHLYVPLDDLFGTSVMRVAIVLRRQSHPVDGHFVVSYKTANAVAYMGCIIDKAGRIIEWIDICVQSFSNVSSVDNYNNCITNQWFDKMWLQWCESIIAQDQAVILTGFEDINPSPVIVDILSGNAKVLTDSDQAPLRLCKDDDLLKNQGHLTYNGSLARYIYNDDEMKPVVKVCDQSGSNCGQKEIAAVLGINFASGVLFNPACGYIMLRKHDSLSLNDLIGIYNRKGFSVPEAELEWKRHFAISEFSEYDHFELFLNNKSSSKKNREVLHLRAMLFNEILAAALCVTQKISRPLLNLSTDSWRIRLLPVKHLPAMWTTMPVLVDNGIVITSDSLGANLSFYMPAGNSEISIYQPDIITKRNKGRLSLRILDVGRSDKISLYGTIESEDNFDIYPNGILNVRFALSRSSFDFYARICKGQKSVNNQWEFYAENLIADDQQARDLVAAKGVLITNVDYSIWPYLGLACDFYSLAVIAMKIFYTEQQQLSYVLDNFVALCKKSGDSKGSIRAGILNLIENDGTWFEKLKIPGIDSIDNQVHKNLWVDIFVMIGLLLPQATRESINYVTDSSMVNLKEVYEKYIKQSKKIVNHTRTFIISQWDENQIVRDVVNKIKF